MGAGQLLFVDAAAGGRKGTLRSELVAATRQAEVEIGAQRLQSAPHAKSGRDGT